MKTTVKMKTKTNVRKGPSNWAAAGTIILLFNMSVGAQTSTWVAPAAEAAKVNPVKSDASTLKDAKKIYTNTCGVCHGEKGKGDGVAAVACKPKPADHTSQKIHDESDGSLFWKMTTGKGPMPTYKKILTEQQRWELVNYIRTLYKGK